MKKKDKRHVQLCEAIAEGRREEALHLLKDPLINPNFAHEKAFGFTPLHFACEHNRPDLASALLARKDTNPNSRCAEGMTPFARGCFHGNNEVLLPLLRDDRVEVNLADGSKRSPLWWGCQRKKEGTVKLLLASGRGVEAGTVSEGFLLHGTTADQAASDAGMEGLALLVRRYALDPWSVSCSLRAELAFDGWLSCSLLLYAPFSFLFLFFSSFFSLLPFTSSSFLIRGYLRFGGAFL